VKRRFRGDLAEQRGEKVNLASTSTAGVDLLALKLTPEARRVVGNMLACDCVGTFIPS
jgi:hypothetical protein